MSKKNKNLDQVIKTARFAYYALYIYEVRDDGNEHKVDVFDFEKWLDKQDIRKYQPLSSGGKLMISDIVSFKTNEPYNLKAIRIYKTRDNIVPELTREGKEPTVVDLRGGENISEALFLLYDPKFKILMVQNNKFSLSLAQLAEWLSRSIHDDRQVVRIEQIFDPSSIDKIKKSKIKNFSIRVANPSIIARGSNLWNLIERPLEYESTAITIKLGVGRSRKNHLKPESINPLVDEVLGLRGTRAVDSANVTIFDEETQRIDHYNLFENKFRDRISYKMGKDGVYDFQEVAEAMADMYNKRKGSLVEVLNPE